jgi:hypothetical protein
MQELFVWFYRTAERPRGVPQPLDTVLAEQFRPGQSLPGFDYPWVGYNPYQMAFPPAAPALRLPEHLFLVVRKTRAVHFDFLPFKGEYKIVSQRFLDYLKQHGPPASYETAKLTVVNPAGQSIAHQPYYALRFGRFDDERLQLGSAVGAEGLRNRFLYRAISLPAPTDQAVFVVQNFCYQDALLLTAQARQDVERQFYCPSIYSAAEFVDLYQQNYRW